MRELDACGIGFVADAHGRPSRAIVAGALTGLANVKHRGAVACATIGRTGCAGAERFSADELLIRAVFELRPHRTLGAVLAALELGSTAKIARRTDRGRIGRT